MGTLVLVRHAQASFGAKNYDELSARGEQQALLLGEHWARRGVAFSAAWMGPRERHARTADLVREGYARAGGSLAAFPVCVVAPELDEMPIERVIKDHLPRLVSEDERVRELFDRFQDGGGGRAFQRLLEEVSAMWIRGELVTPGVEGWSDFKDRIARGLAAATADGEPGRRVLAITSGGPIGATLGLALGLGDAQAAAHAWLVKNASITEILFSNGRKTLASFNAVPHLVEPELETFR